MPVYHECDKFYLAVRTTRFRPPGTFRLELSHDVTYCPLEIRLPGNPRPLFDLHDHLSNSDKAFYSSK